MKQKVKDEIFWQKLYLRQYYIYNEKIRITAGVRLRAKDPDPGDPKRPDPDS